MNSGPESCTGIGVVAWLFVILRIRTWLREKHARVLARKSKYGYNTTSWLRVSGTAKMPQIDQSVRHQLHTVVALLFELKAQQKPFEFVLPGEGPLHAEP